MLWRCPQNTGARY